MSISISIFPLLSERKAEMRRNEQQKEGGRKERYNVTITVRDKSQVFDIPTSVMPHPTKARQVKFIYIVHFIHRFTQCNVLYINKSKWNIQRKNKNKLFKSVKDCQVVVEIVSLFDSVVLVVRLLALMFSLKKQAKTNVFWAYMLWGVCKLVMHANKQQCKYTNTSTHTYQVCV